MTDWDLLIHGEDEDPNAEYFWFPARARDCKNLIVLEGLRFRNCYLTNKAIEQGSASLFDLLYRSAKIGRGKVLHISDYREYE